MSPGKPTTEKITKDSSSNSEEEASSDGSTSNRDYSQRSWGDSPRPHRQCGLMDLEIDNWNTDGAGGGGEFYPNSNGKSLNNPLLSRFALASVDIPLDQLMKTEDEMGAQSIDFATELLSGDNNGRSDHNATFIGNGYPDLPMSCGSRSSGISKWIDSPESPPFDSFGMERFHPPVEFSDTPRVQYQNLMQQQPNPHWIQEVSREEMASQSIPANQFIAYSGALENMLPPVSSAASIANSPSICLDPTGIPAKPAIFVVPQKAVNFTSIFVHFSVQVFNLPPNCIVTRHMFEAVAMTPSGQQLRCKIKKESSMNNGGRVSAIETFLGSFKASEEVGLYGLRVRLVLPLRLHNMHSNFGVANDTADILVSRNYYRESRRTPGTTIRLEFQKYENVPCGDTMISTPKAWGLACDKQTNRIYFTERLANRVSCMDSKGTILFHFNQNLPESQVMRPAGICCDEYNGRVIVCDKDHHRICFFTMDGEYVSSFGTYGHGNGMFYYPWDVDVNHTGTRIVVSDSRNKRIQLFDGSGNFLEKLSVYDEIPLQRKHNFSYPRGVAFDPDGQSIYVTDFNAQNVIQVPIDFISPRGLMLVGKLVRPQGIVVDEIGCILVADSKRNCICHFTSDGQFVSMVRSIGTDPLQFPVNLTLMQNGVIAVMDGQGVIHIL